MFCVPINRRDEQRVHTKKVRPLSSSAHNERGSIEWLQ